MKKLLNLTVALLFIGASTGVVHAASAATPIPAAVVEHDGDLRADLSEPFSAGLIAVLAFNAFVVATGCRVAQNRAARERRASGKAPRLVIVSDDTLPDLV